MASHGALPRLLLAVESPALLMPEVVALHHGGVVRLDALPAERTALLALGGSTHGDTPCLGRECVPGPT